MKTKKINKKLVLNKKVISNLNLSKVKGGYIAAESNDEAVSCDGRCVSGHTGCPDNS